MKKKRTAEEKLELLRRFDHFLETEDAKPFNGFMTTTHDAAKFVGVPRSTIYRWRQKKAEIKSRKRETDPGGLSIDAAIGRLCSRSKQDRFELLD